jgi:hypothetical protein
MKSLEGCRVLPILALCLIVGLLDNVIGTEALPLAEEGAEQAFPGRTGEPRTGLFETPWGRVELKYEVIDGQRVFQGDILLPAEAEDEDPHSEAAGVSQLGRHWPRGVVPVENSGLAQDTRVKQAMQHWEDRTSLRFVIGATSGNRIRFVAPPDADTCSSSVGMQGGIQDINLGANCSVGNARHEIGHAIGLFHEQSRTDRNDFVIVNDGTRGTTNCIQPRREGQFDMFGTDGLNLGAYDTGSIMHYGSDFFLDTSKPGCTATITRRDGTFINANRDALSAGDIAGVQSLYHLPVGTLTVDQRPYVFVQGSDGHLWVHWWTGSAWRWDDQGTPPGVGISGPIGVLTVMDTPTSPQRPYVFVQGSDDHLWVNYWTGSRWDWADQGRPSIRIGFTRLFKRVFDSVGTLTVDQRPYVFVRGSDDHLWVHWWTGSEWDWADQQHWP